MGSVLSIAGTFSKVDFAVLCIIVVLAAVGTVCSYLADTNSKNIKKTVVGNVLEVSSTDKDDDMSNLTCILWNESLGAIIVGVLFLLLSGGIILGKRFNLFQGDFDIFDSTYDKYNILVMLYIMIALCVVSFAFLIAMGVIRN